MDDTTKPTVRLRTNITEIHNWQDVDVALGCLRLLDSQIERINAEQDIEIQKIQEAKKRRTTPLTDRKNSIEQLLEEFVSAHRADWGGKKSLKVVHGKVGFRWATPKVELTLDDATVIQRLKAHGQTQCVDTKETMNKTAIKKVPEAILSTCGVKVIQEERFYYELNKDEAVEYPETFEEDEEVQP